MSNATPAAPSDAAWLADIEAFRQRRDQRLRADDGWLVVAGLSWLAEGENAFGSAPKAAVPLPAHGAPAHAGVFLRKGKEVTVHVAPGVPVELAGKPIVTAQLRSDVPGPADVLELGPLRFFVIERGDRIGIRLRDLESARRKSWKGLSWFPPARELRVVARFVPHAKAEKLTVPTVVGTTQTYESPGRLVFELAGKTLELWPVIEEPGARELFVIFRDETSGRETYGAGRFLYVPLPAADGTVAIDFNRAYAPPCSVSPFATCPMPPKQNRLPVPVRAGERGPYEH